MRLLILLAALAAVGQTPQAPSGQQAPSGPQAPASNVVQVAVNYGPRLDRFASGVIIGDGRMVLTDSGVLPKARDVTIAYSDGEVGDGIIASAQQLPSSTVVLLLIVEKHSAPVAFSPLAASMEIPPDSREIDAFAAGQPQPFQLDRKAVRARAVGEGAAMRWQITPPPPEFMRGGPLLDVQGRLIAVIVKEGDTLVGMPLRGIAAVMEAATGGPVAPAAAAAGAAPRNAANQATPVVEGSTVVSLLKDTAAGAMEVKPEGKLPEVKAATAAPAAPVSAAPVSAASVPAAPALIFLPPPAYTATNLPLRAARVNLIPRPKPKLEVVVAKLEPKVEPKPDPVPKPPKTFAYKLRLQGPRPGWTLREVAMVAPPPAPVAAAAAPASASAPDDSPGSGDARRYVAELVEKKDYVRAVEVLESAIKKNPNDTDLYFQLGYAAWYKSIFKPDGTRRVNVEKSSYHLAIRAFELFVEKAPTDSRIGDVKVRINQLRSQQWGYGLK